MIRIKDYIFNENEILAIHKDKMNGGIDFEYGNDKFKTFPDATFEDIEWNYDSDKAHISLQNQLVRLQQEKDELEEENKRLKKDLELEINISNIKSSQIKTKDIIIKKLQSSKDKTINYVNEKLNADDPVLVEFEIETILELLEGE